MGLVTIGRGEPCTLFVPGGDGDELAHRMRYASRVTGKTVGFAYEHSGQFDSAASLRRQADRDAAEALAVAEKQSATRAIGFSRGARALVGVLSEKPGHFERIALVIPPGGRAAGKYAAWLESCPRLTADLDGVELLVIGNRGDQGHPVRVAEAWAALLGARLEVLPSGAVANETELVADLLAEFLN